MLLSESDGEREEEKDKKEKRPLDGFNHTMSTLLITCTFSAEGLRVHPTPFPATGGVGGGGEVGGRG